MESEIALPFSCSIPFTGIVIDFVSAYTIFFFGAFLAGLLLSRHELRLRGLDLKEAENVFSLAIIGTFIGAKFGYLFEVRHEVFIDGSMSVWQVLLSPAGLVFYGGLFFTLPLLYVYFRLRHRDPMLYADAFTPALALGYAIGRLGCMVSGDGCYGHHAGISIPFIATVFGTDSILPSAHVEVWNTPLMEASLSFIFFLLLKWDRLPFLYTSQKADTKIRAGKIMRESIPGKAFFLYLIWNGIVRFFVEFIRINEPLFSLINGPTLQTNNGRTLPLTYENSVQFGPGPAYFFENYFWHGPTPAQISAIFLVVFSMIVLIRKSRAKY